MQLLLSWLLFLYIVSF